MPPSMVPTANGSGGKHPSTTTTTTTINGASSPLNTGEKKDLESNQVNGLRKSGGDLKPEPAANNGCVRHFLAIMALSAIVMANMNRQAYNQALVRMIRKKPSNSTPAIPPPITAINGTLTTQMPPAALPSILTTTTTTPTPTSWPSSIIETSTTLYGETIDPILGNTDYPEVSTQQHHHHQEEGFDWTGSQISMLQAGFSCGYTMFMIPGGRMSEIYGSKWVIFVSGFGSALCSILTPFIASRSFALLVASRVAMGLAQTGVSPALYAFCTRWLTPEESNVYLPLIKVSVMIGFMSGSLINGFLPWQIMFYIVGGFGFLWSLMWACLASSEPKEHPFISKHELAYIEHALAQRRALELEARQRKDSDGSAASSSAGGAPWLGILTNPVVVVFTLTKFTVKLSTDVQTMQLPMYLRNVFQISDSLNGILNGVNFAIQACFTGFVAYTAKEMVRRKPFGLSKTGVRKLFQGTNNFGMALAYLLITFNMGSLELVCCAVILLSCASMFGSGGEAVLPVDLTSQYAASIMAIANSFANFSGIIMPPVVSWLLANDLTSSDRWNRVWWLISATLCCGGLNFVSFASAESQDFRRQRRRRRRKSANGSGDTNEKSEDRTKDLQQVVAQVPDEKTAWTTKL